MTDRKFIFRILAVVLSAVCVISSVFFWPVNVSADEELDDLQQQYDDLEKQIQRNKKELKEVQGDIKDNKAKLSDLNDEIDGINSQISILNSRIRALNNDIASTEKKIEETNAEIDDLSAQIAEVEARIAETTLLMNTTREMLLGRIRENYMYGEASTMEILFSCDDIASYFTRKELMARVSEQDANLIQELTEKIADLDELQKQLEGTKADLEVKTAELEEEKTKLNARQDDLQDSKKTEQGKQREVTARQEEVRVILSELDKDSAEYKAEIKRQEAEKEALSREIDAYIAEHGSTIGDTPDAAYENDGKMAWPVKFESYISAGYPTYPSGGRHMGIDICATGGNTRGRAFNAAQGGVVIIAINDGNYNQGFGNYCVIDHGDGTQTLYAHSDGLKVSVGQVVKKGQEIGIIGMTGNTTGPHLHFEVRTKNSDGSVNRVQPLNYVSNPYE